jgi:excinuclease ABC subunit C
MYDIANISGKDPTGAMTVSISGALSPKDYRHFTIKSLSTPNDVGMLKEMLQRRLSHPDWPTPSLIVLDGGLTQLSLVKDIELHNIPIISLAKQAEIIYFPTGQSLTLPRTDPGLQLLQRLRDEAHRFSRKLHHKHRSRNLTS